MSETLNTGSFQWDDMLSAAYRTPRNCSRSILMRKEHQWQLWSKADICSAPTYVRFTPESGHVRCSSRCLLWAKSGHRSDYSITSSARASSDGGTDRPSAFAVFRLITSSYLVGACTGMSEGFSPLRMRSTYVAERRTISAVSGP